MINFEERKMKNREFSQRLSPVSKRKVIQSSLETHDHLNNSGLNSKSLSKVPTLEGTFEMNKKKLEFNTTKSPKFN